MGTVIAITSGKGGTGKTSITGGVAAWLALMGRTVLCIDMDIGLRNLDISLGLRRCPGALPPGPGGGGPPRFEGAGSAHFPYVPARQPHPGQGARHAEHCPHHV